MRGLIDGLGTAVPIGAALPAVYADDALAQQLVSALDEVLAPVVGVLDSLHAYVDPALAPDDVLRWLAGWVGVASAGVAEPRLRALVGAAARLAAARGTPAGLAEEVELATGLRVEVADSGGVAWSVQPQSTPPGLDRPGITVRVRGPADPTGGPPADPGLVRALVARAVPAHLPVTVDVAVVLEEAP